MNRLHASLIVLLCAGCHAQTPAAQQPATVAAAPAPTRLEPLAKWADTHEVPGTPSAPLIARGDAPQSFSDGKIRSVDEHPYAFSGNLAEGTGACPDAAAFTFASVKSLGTGDTGCTYSVTHEDASVQWSAACSIDLADQHAAATLVCALDIADASSPSARGIPIRHALYLRKVLGEDSASAITCAYEGFVFERKYTSP